MDVVRRHCGGGRGKDETLNEWATSPLAAPSRLRMGEDELIGGASDSHIGKTDFFVLLST